jgi:hypothetical protein
MKLVTIVGTKAVGFTVRVKVQKQMAYREEHFKALDKKLWDFVASVLGE